MNLRAISTGVSLMALGLNAVNADVLCINKTGKARVAASCNSNETTFTGSQGSGGAGGSGVNTTPCNQAVVGDWSGYLAGSAYADIENCAFTVTPSLALTGGCWQYTGGGKSIPLSSGQLTVQNVKGYQTCAISGTFTFSNGVKATIDANTTPDKDSIVGVHWNSAGGLGTFSAVRLVK